MSLLVAFTFGDVCGGVSDREIVFDFFAGDNLEGKHC